MLMPLKVTGLSSANRHLFDIIYVDKDKRANLQLECINNAMEHLTQIMIETWEIVNNHLILISILYLSYDYRLICMCD